LRVFISYARKDGSALGQRLNTQDLNFDLSGVHEVVLTHSHWDHVTGLLTLRREFMKRNPDALSIVHVPVGIWVLTPSELVEDNIPEDSSFVLHWLRASPAS